MVRVDFVLHLRFISVGNSCIYIICCLLSRLEKSYLVAETLERRSSKSPFFSTPSNLGTICLGGETTNEAS